MAIYHLHVQTIGRADGRSAVAAAAYRSTSRLADERTGAICDYTRKEKALKSGIELPAGAPKWAGKRQELWNEVEKKENRKNSILAYEIDVAIPIEIEKPDREKLIKSYCKTLTEKGHVCDWSIHAPGKKGDERNVHAHIMFTTRKFENGEWSKNKPHMDREEYANFIIEKRADWEKCANAALKELHENQKWDFGHSRAVHKKQYGLFPEYKKDDVPQLLTIDRRTLTAQGVDRDPQIHQGPTATAMERNGKKPDRSRTAKPETDEADEPEISENREKEIERIQGVIRILNLSDSEFSSEYKKLDSAKTDALALAVREHLPEIEKQHGVENSRIENRAWELERRKPNPIEPPKNKLAGLFSEWLADDGKKFARHEDYAKRQQAIISAWERERKTGAEQKKASDFEYGLIMAVKTKRDKSASLKLFREQEKRPAVFERIRKKAEWLLAAASEFSGYRNFKNLLDQVRDARAETARQKELQRLQTQEPHERLPAPHRPRGRSR